MEETISVFFVKSLMRNNPFSYNLKDIHTLKRLQVAGDDKNHNARIDKHTKASVESSTSHQLIDLQSWRSSTGFKLCYNLLIA